MIENAELVMQMLEMYQMYKQQVPVELEEYLRYVAKTGNTLFQWTLVKPFIREKIMNVIAEFSEQSALSDIPPYPNVDPFNYEAMKTMLLERFDTFNGPPFTIQRLCELLSCPRKEYNRVDKFMRAVEKNILVVSTCELRPKREEPIVNGVPDRWENGKESDISMELVDKNNVITDASVLNGNDTVESLLNELESMKTPETKLDESKTEQKDHLVAQVTDKVESNITPEEPKQDTPVLITQDTPLQTQITDSTTEVVEPVDIDVEPVDVDVPPNVSAEHESIVDQPKELNSEVSEIQPVEVKEQIVSDPVDELKDLSQDIELEIVKPKTEEPIVESKELDHLELTPTDADRVEGSIIHQAPDSDNKVELDIDVSQTAVVLEKSDENLESMDVQVEDVSKSMESEVISDNVQEECTNPTEIENDKQVGESTIDVPTVDPVSIDMEVELEKTENDIIPDVIPQESVKENEDIQTTEPNTTVEEPQVQDENKLTESE
ncbi:unnamed protein product [Macrosiphum euphorbiae]|uniref:Serine/threonine-protein phosphatase 4 regulatory subunit 2 n=1 Tax=Macrosiphum euphorbiae TaxID=13131 RepID=A0AAV0VQ85_9HEMI|nr:unnamed protein product [Macrosiphum euphorbiae]